VQHLAYVTDRKIEIARIEAQRNVAEADARDLRQQARQLAEVRAREADQADLARVQAEQAHQKEQEALARTKQLEQRLADLKARQTDRGLELTLSDVLFEFDKANLTPGALRSLAPLVTFLRENPDRTISIEGHTDSLDAYNQQLSQHRAEAVHDFLV